MRRMSIIRTAGSSTIRLYPPNLGFARATTQSRLMALMNTLYVVATPIGNLEDITIHAIKVLQSVDTIACEDTRHTLKLLNAHGISKRLISCHSRTEKPAAERIVSLLNKGEDVAYVSDAGTPGMSDPGSVLVNEVRSEGHAVVPVPGPSAASTLISVAGIRGKGYFFEGFLSPKKGRRRSRLNELVAREEPFLLFESPHRIVKLLEDLADICSDRPICIGREMTKFHEEYIDGTCQSALQKLKEQDTVRGEFSLLVGGKKKH